MKKILVLNSGSSSLKFQLFSAFGDTYDIIAKGNAERIGIDGSFISIKIGDGDKIKKTIDLPTHEHAINDILSMLLNGALTSLDELCAVGHRVVHGGEYFDQSVLITNDVIRKIEDVSQLAPLHNPANLLGIKAIKHLLPDTPQTAVFDTAFHQTMPKEAFLYPLPLEQYTKHKIRRYGFHGTSHQYVAKQAAEKIGKAGKIITCHLGNGASLCAIHNGACVDTSMGFTPLAGVMMGTRTGDIDPYIPLYMMLSQGLSADDVNTVLNKKSGVYGLSGDADMRDVEARYFAKDQQAIDALNVYVHTIVRFIGQYVAVLGGVDAIVFTAGIGEMMPLARELVVHKLSYLGITLDQTANAEKGKDVEISAKGSKVRVFVIPTNEELVIAQDTMRLIK